VDLDKLKTHHNTTVKSWVIRNMEVCHWRN